MRKVLGALIVGFMALAGSVAAAELKPDLTRPAFNADTTLKGDFDGDGRADDVWFGHDDSADRLSLYIRLNRADGGQDFKVISLDAHLAADVQRAPAADYKRDCGSFADACDQARIGLSHDGLILSLEDGITVLVHWQDAAFEQDFIHSDDVRLSRAVATLFALNP